MFGSLLQNRYRLDAELGRGGMGVVYRAHDTLLDRPVAVKVLNPTGLTEAGRARLLAEAQAAARLNHPNVVAVHDAGFLAEADGQPFIVMELVEGAALRAARPASVGEALAIARQICRALEHAHAAGIIHRDLKLENVLLTADRTAKLTDFGLARTAGGHRLTEAGAVFGTITYLAPELIQGGAASPRSDLYALGVLLYELVAGRPPFEADDFITLLSHHLYAPVVPPSTHNPAVPAWLDELIAGLLAKAPDERPDSAAAVGALIDARTTTPTAAFRMEAPPAPPAAHLPAALTRFVGRARELARLRRLLAGAEDGQAPATRLVTLTGSGGVGKTRLALQAAADLAPRFPHGAWLVELAPLTDPARVQLAVAAALGVREEPDRPLAAVLAGYLREKTLLLVLDNCEHLIEASAQLTEQLLRVCPGLCLLATSREALGIEGETILPVPSLSLPAADQAAPEALTAAEAVQLFVDRAGAVQPGFALTVENAPAVAQICRRLDGIALAIELAAARVKLLSPEQIAGRLDDSFRLLTGGSRTALPRQQTLRATMDWSYQLLAEPERRVLCRLAVFMGGWTLEAAEAVCGGDPADLDVLDVLTQLVNKSLVVVDGEAGPEPRYRLLETIRQYAREKLLASGEAESGAARGRHLEYFGRLAAQSEAALIGPRQQAWLVRLEAEAGNLRLAFEWGLDHAPSAALRLAADLWRFWHAHVDWGLGREWLADALARAGAEAPPGLRARALVRAASLALRQSDARQASELLAQALPLARAAGDRENEAAALALQANVLSWSRGDYAEAVRLFQEALALFRSLGPAGRWGEALTLEGLGGLHPDLAQEQALYEAALAIKKAMGDAHGQAETLSILAAVAQAQRDNERAYALAAESIAIRRKLGDRRGTAGLLLQLGYWFQTEYARARGWLDEAVAIARELGSQQGLAYTLRNLGLVEYLHGDEPRAAALFEESLTMARGSGDKMNVAYSLADLGRTLRNLGQLDRAEPLLSESLEITRELGDLQWGAYPLVQLAHVALQRGDLAQAQTRFAESLRRYRRWGVEWGQAESLAGLAGVAETTAPERAVRWYAAADQRRALIGAPRPPVEIAAEAGRVAALRAQLGEAAFAAAWEAGRALTTEQAVQEALPADAEPA